MKKLVIAMIIILLVAFSSQVISAQSYMRWVDWPSQPNYVASADDMAQVFYKLSHNEIQANTVYYLRNGISYKINKPELYLDYMRKAVRAADAGAITDDQIFQDIAYSDPTNWGNDIPYMVKNYYVAKNGEVRYFSTMKTGVPILLVNGIPILKRDCGNPLVVYSEDYKPTYSRSAVVADSIKIKNGISDTVYVVIQVEEKEDLSAYQTTYCYWRGYWDYSYVWTYPVYYPYYYVGYSWGFYRPYWWHHGPIYFSNCNYYHPYYHGWYTYDYHRNYYGRHDNSWRHGHRNNNYKSFDYSNYTNYNKRYSENRNIKSSNSGYNQKSLSNSRNVNNQNTRNSNSGVQNINSRKGNVSNTNSVNRSTNTSTNNYNRERNNSVNQNKSTNNGTRSNPVYNKQRQNYTPNYSNSRGTSNYSPSRSNNSSRGNRSNVSNSRPSNSSSSGNRSSSGSSNNGRRK